MCQCFHKVIVQGARAVVRVERKEVVHVAPERQPLVDVIHCICHFENTWVGFALREAEVE
eukprot:2631863-Pleurochrysis_carterae.AAC.2